MGYEGEMPFKSNYPCLFKNSQTDSLEFIYKQDLDEAGRKGYKLSPNFFSPSLSIYFKMDSLTKLITNPSSKLGQFRVKKKNLKIFNKELELKKKDLPYNSISFEINAFNAVSCSSNTIISVRNLNDYLVFKRNSKIPEQKETNVIYVLK